VLPKREKSRKMAPSRCEALSGGWPGNGKKGRKSLDAPPHRRAREASEEQSGSDRRRSPRPQLQSSKLRRQQIKLGLMQPTPFTTGEHGARHDGFPPSSATPCAVPCAQAHRRAGPFRKRKGEHSGLGWATGETYAVDPTAQGATGKGAHGRPLDARAGSADVSTPRRPACVARPEALLPTRD